MTDQHGNEWVINDTRGYVDAGPSCDELAQKLIDAKLAAYRIARRESESV